MHSPEHTPQALSRLVHEHTGEVLLFGLTPPRAAADDETVARAASRVLEQVQELEIDGLILYDLDDESDRVAEPRPFPFQPTMDPAVYLRNWLTGYQGPTIVYRSVGKYDEATLAGWMDEQDDRTMTVFVGASSPTKPVKTSLKRAMALRTEHRPDLMLGGVAIPERHITSGTEHLRLRQKTIDGCSYFVTQVVYNLTTAKDLVSDYVYACQQDGVEPDPIIYTLSLCGSRKTLEFLQWLGINVPRWVQNDLLHDRNPLQVSYEHSLVVAQEMAAFSRRLGVPFGFNVESVSSRREEFEAALEFAGRVRKLLAR